LAPKRPTGQERARRSPLSLAPDLGASTGLVSYIRDGAGPTSSKSNISVALAHELATLCKPLNGQRPRPWLTDYTDPERCRVFVVGKNQASAFTENVTDGEFMRRLYNDSRSLASAIPTKTRRRLDNLVRMLGEVGVHDVLQTNVICYSTTTAKLLTDAEKALGRRVFAAVLKWIQPRVIVVHGVDADKELSRVIPKGVVVFSIPTLAAPGYRKTTDAKLPGVVQAVAEALA
jgi:hypothetical protein